MKNIYKLLLACSMLGFSACISNSDENKGESNLQTREGYKALTKEERAVILDCGTEAPFSGDLLYVKDSGEYLCKQCDAPLFLSDTKFDSGSGWPSFDTAIEGAIKYIKDPDGMRTEIRCANCDGHLGHVFYNEGFTAKNARYCVNSISLTFKTESTKND